jgi:exodeoxyribonuclease VII large subunit
MVQPSLFGQVIWPVSRLTQHIRTLLESDLTLMDLWVQGEISNVSRPASGHIYFTIKDTGASLRAVMWRGDALRLQTPFQDGMAVEVHGHIGVYEPQGQYQFYADQVRPLGEGQLYQEFLRLKAELEAEGLFAAERKQQIPDLPGTIGIVTSASGAALRDMLDTLQRRLPLVEVILAAATVQGAEAPPALVAALAALDRLRPDVILLARGGGSMEDLWPFNDERVVRAVAELETPVISGVGHETDFSLCDFAADLRAPTPTAAAELATPISIMDLKAHTESLERRLSSAIISLLVGARHGLQLTDSQLGAISPLQRILTGRQRLDDLARRTDSSLQHVLSLSQAQLSGLERRLYGLNPLTVLARGYAIVTNEKGLLVSKVKDARQGGEVSVQVSDGTFIAKVLKDKEK